MRDREISISDLNELRLLEDPDRIFLTSPLVTRA